MRTLNGRTFSRGGRRLLLSLLLLAATAPAAAGRQAAPKLDWREFTSEPGRFSVKLPGEPRVSHPQTVMGPLTISRNLHKVSVGGYQFEIDYMDMPAGFDPELALEGGISGLINPMRAAGGRVLTNDKVARGSCEGREATVSVPSRSGRTGFVQARVFNSGQRYYVILFVAEDDRPAVREVARAYMDSLVISDGCRAPVTPAAAPSAAPVRSTVAGSPDAATGWRRMESAEHGFGVLMPGAARRESAQAQVEPFPLFHHEYVNESDEAFYSAEVLGDYPQGFSSGATDLENRLDITIYAVKKNLGSMALSFGEPRKLSVGGYPGREYTVTNEQVGLHGRVRLYVTPRRVYIFMAFSRGGRAPSAAAADIERFFSSVKVSPK